jgi:ATP-binding cassette, subfamily B, bacterial HlyB/CyaB
MTDSSIIIRERETRDFLVRLNRVFLTLGLPFTALGLLASLATVGGQYGLAGWIGIGAIAFVIFATYLRLSRARHRSSPPDSKRTNSIVSSEPSYQIGVNSSPQRPVHIAELDGLLRNEGPFLTDSIAGTSNAQLHPRLLAVIIAARYFGLELDPHEFRNSIGEMVPSAVALAEWANISGMWSRALRLRWRHLMSLSNVGPVVLLFNDGNAALLTGVSNKHKVVFIKDPTGPAADPSIPVDELRLAEVWNGETILLRAERGGAETDPLFTVRWLLGIVTTEKKSLSALILTSLALSALAIIPPLIVMLIIDKVITRQSLSTLFLMSVILGTAVAFETLLGFVRRFIIADVGARTDTKLNLYIFARLTRLPLDYFERHPVGETIYKISQIHQVRQFITGKLMTTLLDLITLVVVLPFLFWLNATIAWIVLICSTIVLLILLAYLRPMRVVYGKVSTAETNKQSTLGEAIFGVRTIKFLALEPQHKALWHQRVTEACKRRLAFNKLANWPQTLATLIERFMWMGIIPVGAFLALVDNAGFQVGSLLAIMMLSQRISIPLVGLARLIEEWEEVGGAMAQAAGVLNRPLEVDAALGGLRPRFAGAISVEDLSFTYAGTKSPALDRVSFSIPAGSMLGIVGRSGSGKSTLTRLLQGINRDYSGFLKIDGTDLREINLRHLRTSFGVVPQDNLLFRGSIRDNILAGRPGLTLEDAVRAARLAGAEEFIERMPNGYETYIEEGSPNLSGGQRQCLAIARALVCDPRILILDDATSTLDPESEALVNANLLRIARGRTMIIVSRQLSSLTDCDQILVLEKGAAMDIAPHRVLLERCAVYRHLWMRQIGMPISAPIRDAAQNRSTYFRS